ncbi:MAG: hypothetical protein P794_06050 [Epsilonproteobacteria bacterium (ex Lamellibrachia satsuma)]|nr:MAG: hypothetical protein P794_06050 [Epsilonproteobacteria bacterium (ex Lamellibrachia satsuma)]
MDYKFVMPRLSDSIDEGHLVEWKIRPGDEVKNGDVIAEVESDKGLMEIQTFKNGTVKELLRKAGSTVPAGTPIAVIDTNASSDSKKQTEEMQKERSGRGEKVKKTIKSSSDKEKNSSVPERKIESHEIPLSEPLDMLHRAMIGIVNYAVKKPIYHMTDHIDATLLNRYVTKELTMTVWLLKLFSEAMMRQKYFRLTLVDDQMQLWPNASISVAMASGEYLYMPVFKVVNRKTPTMIAKELQQFKMKISERKLTKGDMTGSTFGISNLGMTGIEQFDAMINKDDCAIAAIGSEIEGRITITLTIDHRIINGYQAALFMQELKALAEDAMFFKEAAQ